MKIKEEKVLNLLRGLNGTVINLDLAVNSDLDVENLKNKLIDILELNGDSGRYHLKDDVLMIDNIERIRHLQLKDESDCSYVDIGLILGPVEQCRFVIKRTYFNISRHYKRTVKAVS